MRTFCRSLIASAAAMLALAGIAAASATDGPVGLGVHGAVAHPGQRTTITIINGSSRSIVYGPCFVLARRVDGHWRTITRTHGFRLACSTVATSQRAHSRRTWTLVLYEDLKPGRYRVTLAYRSGSIQRTARTYITLTASCAMPSGAVTVATTPQVIVSRRLVGNTSDTEYLGCAKPIGQVHVLVRLPGDLIYDNYTVPSVAVAGYDAALGVQQENEHYGDTYLSLAVFDLRTGRGIAHRGGLLEGCVGDGDFTACGGRLKTVVVNAHGDAAADFSYLIPCPPTMPPSVPGGPCTQEQIDASDSSGLHPVDTAIDPFGSSGLTFSDLTLTGQVLRWNHSGVPQSITLPSDELSSTSCSAHSHVFGQ